MNTVSSRDGTAIAYERVGDGPAVILVDGALCHRASGPARPLAARLAERFTVYAYDRRGRGDSGDAATYAVQREVEDLEALVAEAGGRVHLYGISSGAVLALDAVAAGLDVDRLAVYEPPFVVDDSRAPIGPEYPEQLRALLAADRRADAVRLFMRQVGLPRVIVALMRVLPAWKQLKAVAHTLPYDAALTVDFQRGTPLDPERWSAVGVPVLVGCGGKSPAWMRTGTAALAALLPDARSCVLPGQTHMVSPKALGPVLSDFFTERIPAAI